jgi:hypothetical protein
VTVLIAVLGVVLVVLALVTLRLARRLRTARRDASEPVVSPPIVNVAVVKLYEIWMRRVELEELGARASLWADLSESPQYATWRRLAEARGAQTDEVPGNGNGNGHGGGNSDGDGACERYMSRGLLAEVLYAAGGVERELQEVRKTLGYQQRPVTEVAPHPPVPPRPRQSPESAHPLPPAGRPGRLPTRGLIAGRPVRDASYSFVNLISWARLTVDRTDRPGRPGSSERAGLLAALRPGELHDQVEVAVRHLRAALVDSRPLASYAFHSAAVMDGETPGWPVLPDRTAMTPPASTPPASTPPASTQPASAQPASAQAASTPPASPLPAGPSASGPLTAMALTADPLAGPALQFTEQRDMLTYATTLMAAVEAFVNQVLDAFAASQAAASQAAASQATNGQGATDQAEQSAPRATGSGAAGQLRP